MLSLAADWLSRGAQIVILGTGDPVIESSLTELAAAHPHAMGFKRGYDESLAHLIEAGADAFLMPSRFEPCGLNQMYSMRYGTPPIVRATGGLADTVRHASASAIRDGTATGFVFDLDSSSALDAAVTETMTLYADTESWTKIMRTAMHRDFSWGRSALQYAQLYQQLLTPNADVSPPRSPAHNS